MRNYPNFVINSATFLKFSWKKIRKIQNLQISRKLGTYYVLQIHLIFFSARFPSTLIRKTTKSTEEKKYARWVREDFGNGALGVNLTFLVQYHFPIGSIDGFNWFVGGGAHIGLWGGESNHPWFPNGGRTYFQTGIDAIGGVEYTFAKIPLTLQADIKPSVHFFEYPGVWYDEIAFSARYTF